MNSVLSCFQKAETVGAFRLSPDRPRVPSDSSPDISPTERLATSSSSSEDGLDDVLRRLEELTAAMRERSARYEAADASDNALRDLLRDE